MILRYKRILFLGLGLLLSLKSNADMPHQVEQVIENGFPSKSEVLLNTTNRLFQEYQSGKNITSLIFYSYGMLRLADHYKAINDYVNALEYSKLGFFYLDEATDLNENNLKVHYLRARIDAYLPAELGRCVVALSDTDLLRQGSQQFDAEILARINYMRYRAMLSCHDPRANVLLAEMKKGNSAQLKLLELASDSAPEWDISEVSQILMPLMKGE